MQETITGALVGLGFGLGRGIFGILKNKQKPEWEGLDWKKLAPTLIVTGLAGAWMGIQGMTMEDTQLEIISDGLLSVGAAEILIAIGKTLKGWLHL